MESHAYSSTCYSLATLPVTLSCLAWDAKRYFNIIDWHRNEHTVWVSRAA